MNLHASFAATTLDRESLPQDSLDIADRVRTNPLPWKGQFSPQLVERLLAAYTQQPSVVLDPFVGSGTSLVEAARQGHSAHGFDLNPAAVILARVYQLTNLDLRPRSAALCTLRERLADHINLSDGPLFPDTTSGSTIRLALESALTRIWHNASPGVVQDLAAALVVLCDFHRKTLDEAVILKTWQRLEKTVQSLPITKRRITAQHADARSLPIESSSVDIILTSPPYINVHNYHQKYRRSVEAMGWDVLGNARAEIGSNRQNRGNRFLTVIQYSLDMALALCEMARVSKFDGQLILVVGRESTVRGAPFFNGELVTEIAVQSAGLRIERRQERRFRNRYGSDIYEDILHFRCTKDIPDRHHSLATARRIAELTLLGTRKLVSSDQCSGIDDAIARLNTVSPSPALMANARLRKFD